MDGARPRDRIISILNNDSCPSFCIRRKETPTVFAPRRLSIERPNILRQPQYTGRISSTSSVSSAGSPPLLRYDSNSSSSSKSTASMDSSPSPSTPAYGYNDGLVPFNDLTTFMPSPTSITPFMDQHGIITPSLTSRQLAEFSQKSMPTLAPAQYPIIPMNHSTASSVEPASIPSLSSEPSNSGHSNESKDSPTNTSTPSLPVKKNKYPCPYVTSHKCPATFTTSGHAARHGKKHTGEKGVHCPICNKAFTRKDNMKQHQRTHKNGPSNRAGIQNTNSESSSSAAATSAPQRRNKAAIMKETRKAKEAHAQDLQTATTSTPSLTSILSQQTLEPLSLQNSADQPTNLFSNSTLLPAFDSLNGSTNPTSMSNLLQANAQSLYQPLLDPTTGTLLDQTSTTQSIGLPSMLSQQMPMGQTLLPMLAQQSSPSDPVAPPPLLRGFSDLDTLAEAAAAEENSMNGLNAVSLGMGPMGMSFMPVPIATGPMDQGPNGGGTNGGFYM